MIARNHILFGVSTFVIFQETILENPFQNGYLALALVVIGSLMPDIDHPKSWFGQTLFFISKPLSKTISHRGVTHSLIAIVLLSILLSDKILEITAHSMFYFAFVFGYISHIVADFFTKQGVPIFWPIKKNIRMPVLNFKTGSKIETIFVSLLLILAIILSIDIDYQGLIDRLEI